MGDTRKMKPHYTSLKPTVANSINMCDLGVDVSTRAPITLFSLSFSSLIPTQKDELKRRKKGYSAHSKDYICNTA